MDSVKTESNGQVRPAGDGNPQSQGAQCLCLCQQGDDGLHVAVSVALIEGVDNDYNRRIVVNATKRLQDELFELVSQRLLGNIRVDKDSLPDRSLQGRDFAHKLAGNCREKQSGFSTVAFPLFEEEASTEQFLVFERLRNSSGMSCNLLSA